MDGMFSGLKIIPSNPKMELKCKLIYYTFNLVQLNSC